MGTPPISAELWERLRRLDRTCTFSLMRMETWSKGGGIKRTWRVRICQDETRLFDYVHVERPTLSEALTLAVDEAERRGWHALTN